MDRNMVLIGGVLMILFALFFLSTSSAFAPAPAAPAPGPAHLTPGLDTSKLASGALLPSGGKDCSQFGSDWVHFTDTLCKKS